MGTPKQKGFGGFCFNLKKIGGNIIEGNKKEWKKKLYLKKTAKGGTMRLKSKNFLKQREDKFSCARN